MKATTANIPRYNRSGGIIPEYKPNTGEPIVRCELCSSPGWWDNAEDSLTKNGRGTFRTKIEGRIHILRCPVGWHKNDKGNNSSSIGIGKHFKGGAAEYFHTGSLVDDNNQEQLKQPQPQQQLQIQSDNLSESLQERIDKLEKSNTAMQYELERYYEKFDDISDKFDDIEDRLKEHVKLFKSLRDVLGDHCADQTKSG